MRKQIQDYVKKCTTCQRYKCSNRKPTGLMQSLPMQKRFEVIAIDLFGPLPETIDGYKNILIVEDMASCWVETLPIKEATSENCANILIDEVFLRYGIPRKIISDNGTQFISAVMQKITFVFNIEMSFIPVYHPQSNPVERKNRDLKTHLAILTGTDHTKWKDVLPVVRFCMNTAKCSSTGYSAAYITFGREFRTMDDVQHDVRDVVSNENFIPEITPKLRQLTNIWYLAKENNEKSQQTNQQYIDTKRSKDFDFKIGDLVWVKTHLPSKASKRFTAKFAPKRDGPYTILRKHGPASYEIGDQNNNNEIIGKHHSSALTPCQQAECVQPIYPKAKRGRPRKNN